MLCAQEALAGLGLDRVLLVPVHTPPHKRLEAEPGVEHRLELCRRAVAGSEGMEVSSVEADRPGASFTIDTLRALHERTHRGDDLTFIVGADQASGLPGWRDPAAILEPAELGVAQRDGVREADVLERLAALPGAAELAADKLAIDVVVLDLHGVIGYTDYFVICSGNTDRQTKAIHDNIPLGMKKDHGLLPRRVGGVPE